MVKEQVEKGALVVIMAGGQGSRFWPVSRLTRPKQFLSMNESGESLIQATVRRVEPLVAPDRMWVLSNAGLVPLITEHVPNAHVVCEPIAKNTAACIGLAAVHALVRFGDADPALVVLPADHAVRDEQKLRDAIREAIQAATAEDVLVTIGIPPTHPHTGYGYIKKGQFLRGRTNKVERFFEKPSLERAQKYCESGEYSWNSGMFVWRASVILSAFEEFLPAMYSGLMKIKQVLEQAGPAGQLTQPSISLINDIFAGFESISIDFGVLEHARNCVMVNAEEFGWNDVGSWDQWAENFATDEDGNLIKGDAVVIDSTGCVVQSDRRLLALVGVTDVVVIDAGDALLVVSREKVQDVRKVVEELKKRGRTDVL